MYVILGSPSSLVYELVVGACLVVGKIQREVWYFLTRNEDVGNLQFARRNRHFAYYLTNHVLSWSAQCSESMSNDQRPQKGMVFSQSCKPFAK